MIIPDDVRKCVAFIGHEMADKTFKLRGSVFFLSNDPSKSSSSIYAVTAKHVIDGIRSRGIDKVSLRMNTVDGQAQWFHTSISEWFSHPTNNSIDVSIIQIGLTGLDHLCIPYNLVMTDQSFKNNEIGLGDEVFIIGLFRYHTGLKRNIPIVRIGNLAAINEEKVITGLGEIDAFLIEARSIGGLSGSPVFLNMGAARFINGKMLHSTGGKPLFQLLGLVHGHYDDVGSNEVDGIAMDKSDSKVNAGIAIVVTFHSIIEVINIFESNQKVRS